MVSWMDNTIFIMSFKSMDAFVKSEVTETRQLFY